MEKGKYNILNFKLYYIIQGKNMFRDIVKRYEKNSIAISILMLILSLCLIFMPFSSAVSIIWMFGIFTIVDGIVHMISYFNTDVDNRIANFEFAEGIMEILSGILIFISAEYLVMFMPVMIGVWIIVKSIVKMQIALNMRNSEESSWVLVLILSIITLLIGIFIILNPLPEFVTLTITALGVLLAIYEIINILEAVYMLYKLKD